MPLTLTPDHEPETPAAPAAPKTQPEPNLDTEIFSVALPLRYAFWLRRRASLYGDTPEGHVERILREYKAQHDQSAASMGRQAPPEVGESAVTFRPR
jgi:hypothetical protein